MKKYLFVLVLLVPLMFFGCSKIETLDEVSQNLNSYHIVASLDTEAKTISAKEEVTITNEWDEGLEYVYFHLHPNAFKENRTKYFAVSLPQEERAYGGEKSYGNIEIRSAQENGQEQEFFVEGEDEHIMKVKTQNLAEKGYKTNITICFVVTLAKVNHRLGYGEHTINLGNWYPILCVFDGNEWDTEGYLPTGDPFYSKMANYEVEISYDKNLTLASTGNLVDSHIDYGVKTDKYSALAVRDFAMVFSNEFACLEESVDGINIKYFYFDDEEKEEHLKTATKAISTFNELFGKYPYKTLCVVKADFLHGGMEYPNLVYVSCAIANESEYKNVIVHEIAHQWWYSLVGNDQKKYGFIDEGLAEFSTALFYELNDGYEMTKEDVIGNAISSYLLYADVYKEVYGGFNASMNRPISAFNTETEYVYLTYVKGLLMFDSICDAIGEKKMFKCLSGLFEDYCFKELTPQEMIESFEKHSKRKLESFITSWLDGSVVLEELSG